VGEHSHAAREERTQSEEAAGGAETEREELLSYA
jgi:hypothetical protein